MRQSVSFALILCLVVPLVAAEREVIRADWARFRSEVMSRKLENCRAHIRTTDGRETKAKVERVTDTGLIVKSGEIPRERVASVRFDGKLGHRGLWGTLIGAGGGAAIGGAIVASSDISEGPFVIILPASIGLLALIGGLVGYWIGHASAPHAPEFVLQP